MIDLEPNSRSGILLFALILSSIRPTDRPMPDELRPTDGPNQGSIVLRKRRAALVDQHEAMRRFTQQRCMADRLSSEALHKVSSISFSPTRLSHCMANYVSVDYWIAASLHCGLFERCTFVFVFLCFKQARLTL